MAHRLQYRRDTKANWLKYNPVLMEGEVGYETDTHHQKVGDGVSKYSELEYEVGVGNITQETGDSESLVMSQKAVSEKFSELGSEVKNNIPQIYINSINAQLEGNLFNKDAVGIIKDFIFYDVYTDKYKELEGYNISEYIAVEPNSVYSIDKRVNIKGYDKHLNYVLSLTANDTKLEIPENVYWIRFSYYSGWGDAIYVNKGEVSSPNRKYGIISAEKLKEKSINKEKLDDELANEFKKISTIETEVNKGKGKFILYNNLLHIQGEGNIFNKDAAGILKNKNFYDYLGNITDREGYNVSDYMAVKPNSTYRISVGIAVHCYDINFVHLGVVSASEKVFTTLEDTYWLRFSYYAGWTINLYEDSANVKSSKYGLTRTNDIEDNAVTQQKLSEDVQAKLNSISENDGNKNKQGSFFKRGNLNQGSSFVLPKNSVSVNEYITFSGNISDSFGSLLIGHGRSEYTSAYIKIEADKVTAYSMLSSEPTTKIFEHGLTIENNIQVSIKKKKSTDVEIKVSSNGKSYKFNWASWYGNNGQPFVECEVGNLTNCSFGWTSKGIVSDIWAFGDSYFGVNGTIRWMAYLISEGHTNLIVNAYGGQGSVSAYEDLTNLFTIGTPKKILWCLGMNDVDSSTAVNSNWLNTYNSVKSLCKSNNIELILATIPTVPTRINKYKNEIVRNSGYRYIDFDKAVGADETTGAWFGDMLYSDGVHPSETGALALYHQAIADMPELLNC